MTDYVFVLGKNWTISIAELLIFLHDMNLEFRLKDHTRNVAVVSIENVLKVEDIIDIQEALGGCFKIARVVTSYPRRVVETAYPVEGRGFSKENRATIRECSWVDRVWRKVKGKKIKFGVSTYPVFDDKSEIKLKKFTLDLDQWIKKKLLAKGAQKVAYFSYDEPDRRRPSRQNTALWPHTIAKHGLLSPPNSEIIAAITQNDLFIAKTIVVYDSMLQQYRDESRPFISSKISTSPKICRTLLSLAGAKRGDTVLDPFCGTGTLLMEASMLGMNVIGIDIDGNAIRGAEMNLLWLAKELNSHIDYRLIKGDAKLAGELVGAEVDAVACEPHLGPIYSSKPSAFEVEETIKELTELYNSTLQSLSKILRDGGRVSMTLPDIMSDEGRYNISIKRMLKDTDYEVVPLLANPHISHSAATDSKLKLSPNRTSLPERKMGQIVQRSIVTLVKI